MGVVHHYALEAEARSLTDPGAITGLGDPSAGPLLAQVGASGTLDLVHLQVDEDGRWLAARVRDGRLHVRMGEDVGEDRAHDAALAGWTLAHADDRGALRRVFAPDGQPETASGLMRALLGAVQILPPAGDEPWCAEAPLAAGPCAWERTQAEPVGVYDARYVATRADGAVAVRRVRTRLHPPPLGPDDVRPDLVQIPTGQVDALVRPDGVIERVRVDEGVATEVAGRPVGASHTRLTLQHAGDTALDAAALEVLRDATRDPGPGQPVYLGVADPAVDERLRRDALGDATPEAVLERLSAASDALPPDVRATLARTVEALLHLHPDQSAAVASVAVARGLDDEAGTLAVDALARVGHGSAQEAVRTVVAQYATDAEAVQVLLPLVAHLVTPSEAVVAQVGGMTASTDDAIAWTARFALGVMARGLLREAPDRGHAVGAELVRGLTAARADRDARIRWLRAVGNAGPAADPGAVLEAVSDPDDDVRAAALWALRFQTGSAIEARLIAALRDDPAVEARLASLRALVVRDPATPAVVDGWIGASMRDASPVVRRMAVLALGPMAGQSRVRARLEQAAAQDGSDDVRAAAARMLRAE